MQGSVNGYVVRANDGQPVAEATISVVSGPGMAPDIAPMTDDDGYFALDGLGAGEWELRALGPTGSEGAAVVSVFDNAVSDITIILKAGAGMSGNGLSHSPPTRTPRSRPARAPSKQPDQLGSVHGRVLFGNTGLPLCDATISVVEGAGRAPDMAPLSDAAGYFSMEGLPAGLWRLKALGTNGETGEATVLVKPNMISDLIVEVASAGDRTGQIWGRVVSAATGYPIADASVSALLFDGLEVAAQSDAMGRFSVPMVPPGTFMLNALNVFGHSGTAELTIHDASPTYVVIEIEDAPRDTGSVQGRITLEDTGMPVAGAIVSLANVLAPTLVVTVTTDASGWFSLENLDLGPWIARVATLGGEEVETGFDIVRDQIAELSVALRTTTQVSDLVGRECRIHYDGAVEDTALDEQRVNFKLDPDDRIQAIWFG